MLTFSADVNAGVPLAFVASRYHVIDVSNTGDRYHIELGDGTTPMDHDLELTWKPVTDGAPRALLFTEDVQGETHALLMMLPPDEFEAQAPHMKRELIFVIDTSGSMHGTSLEQAKRALALALSGLHMGDRFNVIQFNSSTSALFGHSVEANALNIASARRYVSGLTANGGTEMRPALSKALLTAADDAYLRQVIFITDGSVGDEDELYRLIENRLGSTRLFTVGIGSAPNSWFMRKAAEAGRGTFTTIGALHEVNEKMERLFRKLEQPQVTDIAVDWPGGSAVESYPPAVPDLYAGEPVVVRARIGNATDGVVRISGQSLLGGWEVALELGAGVPNSGIAALWARSKIEHLMDGERSGAGEDETRRAIVATAMAHHLVSKYTSLVAIDKTPVRPAAAGVTSEQVPNLLPYGQSQQAIFGFTATATGAPLYRANGIALLLLALLLTLFYLRGEFRHDKAAHG
jgi:Ca-activated chloride channel family protein